MKNKKLGVNIDHVATIRNARGESYPDPLQVALLAKSSGADSVTIHLREDRRHIRDYDLINIINKLKIPINLEIAPTNEMLKIAIKHKPNFVCIVPEKRSEVTTEGGLNLSKKTQHLKKIILRLKKNKIRVALFIEPKLSDVIASKKLKADALTIVRHRTHFSDKNAVKAAATLSTSTTMARLQSALQTWIPLLQRSV